MEYDLAVKKLALFIKYSERGFVLLTVNEWEILKSLHDVISEWLHPAFYNMEKTEYRSVLDDLSATSPRENNSVVFENFNLPMERLNDLLERFNLGRDVFLNKTRYCIFIVPLYVELYIQEYFPNLYSYFEFKEQYLLKYKNYCEFILPEDGYLKTKSMQRALKETLIHQNNDIVQKLEGCLHIHISEDEFKHLEKEVYEYVEEIKNSSKNLTNEVRDANEMFCCRLMVSLARVATLQTNYDKAIEIYREISVYKQIKNSPKIAFEILNGIADTFLYSENYKNAYNSYSRSLDFIVKEFNDNEKNESDFLNIKVRIYSKLALCEFKQGNVENVIKYLEITKFHLERMDEDEKKELFPVYYNYLLMYLDINPDRTQEAEHLLKMLEAFGNNDMQRAMFLTIKAWYLGIINGNLREAARAADEALRIKRHSYIENDFRIAESHYINAMIRLFQGNYQQAEYCCMKSINILKNFKLHTYQKEKSRDLLEKITSLDSDDLHNKL